MKTSISNKLILFFLASMTMIRAYPQQENGYITAMVNHLKSFSTAKSVPDYQELANGFERIASAETDKWHPFYYAGLCYINMGFSGETNNAKDSYIDKAQTFIDKALTLSPAESEIHVLQALLYQARIGIDPAGRGMVYSGKASEELNKAKKLNPENPRTYYLLALNVLHTPEAFGGGAKVACPLFEEAAAKFNSHESKYALDPKWGAEHNQLLYQQNCNNTN